MDKGEDITTKFKVDISDLKKGISEANKQIKLANAQFKSASAGMDDWTKSSEGISTKLKQLGIILENEKSKLSNYRKQFIEVGNAYKENKTRAEELRAKLQELANNGVSKTTEEYKKYQKALTELEKEQLANKNVMDNLRITYENQKATVQKTEKEIRNYSISLDELKNGSMQTEKSVDDLNNELKRSETISTKASDGFTVVKGALASLVADGFRKAIDASKEFAKNMITTAAEVKAESAMFEQTFGDMGDQASTAIKRVADSSGILETRLNTAGARLYAFARSNGGKAAESLQLMEEALQASADSAAYYDKSLDETTETMMSFLKGNFANDAALGISATEFTRNAKATELFGKKYNDLTELQKQQTLLKMVTDAYKVSGAFGQAARESDGWENVMGNLKETWRQFQAKAGAPFLEALIPIIQKLTKNFKEWSDSVDWNSFGKKVEKSFDKALNGFEWLLKNGDKVTKITKLMITAFAVKKINDFGNGIINTTKSLKMQATQTKLLTNVTNSMTIAQKASTIATNAGTISMRTFNTVVKSNPVGFLVSAIMLGIEAFKGISKWIKESTKNTNEHYIASEKLRKQQDELSKSTKENSKARKDSITSAENEGGAIDILFHRLMDLEGIQGKTNAQKQTMKQLVSELNELVPELNLKYDEEKDKLNQSTEAIKNKIDAQKELIKAEAAQEKLKDIAKEQIENETKRNELLEEQRKAVKKLEEAQKAADKAWENYQNGKGSAKEWYAAKKNVENLTEAVNNNRKSLEKNAKTLDDLKKEYAYTEEYAANAFNSAEIEKKLSAFTQKCVDAGKEIPKTISEGMRSGYYAIPDSVEGLEKLINFDEALKSANLSGKNIPIYISQGIIDGKISLEEAMKQLNDMTTLADNIQKMIDEGKAIPKTLAKGITDGSVSVKDANKILQDSVTYDDLIEKVKNVGMNIPKNLAAKIKLGKITVQEANEELQAMLNFNSVIEKAEKSGYEIPKSLVTGIQRGETSPKIALERVQALINYDKAIQEAGIKGLEIPTKLKDGILSGEIPVTDANNKMNNWINFNDANQDAILAGMGIPNYIINGILNGELDIKNANSKMNSWIEFKHSVEEAKKAGISIPDELSENISGGIVDIETATNNLKTAIAQKINGTKEIGINAGGDLIEGTKQGINNRDKQNGVYAAIGAFGGTILSTLKKALDEHSPSKASNKIAQYLIEGFGIGIKKKENGVFNQISDFGKNVVDILNDEICNNSTIQDMIGNVKGSVSNMKQAVSNMSIPSLQNVATLNNNSMTRNINNNYTQIINAPKQPSRIELYRQTKNLLALKGGN